MAKWIYLVVRKGSGQSRVSSDPELVVDGDLPQALEAAGAAGWELVYGVGDPAVENSPMIFKKSRPGRPVRNVS